ncbi:MAG: NAD-dependent malic enzyme [Bacteroidota bacterium]|nr:NAD-dependent malic enzyme [Bacteroidota bacterium]MDP4234557.1 NAD-dependent malic enzyme [Bacteroidota bacterium]MDP4243686.1 NAD-dependent malic enzyme [Bacteroidota bacterium]MDP4288366.1 NAD-dependent malic enzyme [Bacteroidota bacterium]
MSKRPLPTKADLLRDPTLNKGRAFTAEERVALGLRGLLPPRIISLDEQAARVIATVRAKKNDLDRYNSLIGLQDRNETLFYHVLIHHLEELMPIIYTPTIGQACQEYGHIFRRSRGMYISDADRGQIRSILANWPRDDVRVIVVTDGERVLGLGDLGAHGMGIPVGKLSLYVACAGVKPEQCLPITLDVGTNNEVLLSDPAYLGLPHERVRGEEYDSFIEEFLHAANDRFPNVLIQLEDFGNANAFRLLEKYRDQYCLFNDDIQGTAAVTLSGLFSALRITGGKLCDQTIVLFGAGEAATGISNLIVLAMTKEGMPEEEARKHCWLMDSKGLVVKSRTDLAEHKKPYAHQHEPLPDLFSAVQSLRPTVLIGASGQCGAFTHAVLSQMAGEQVHPIIFALSNPTSQSECTAEEAYRYTEGRAIFASGSPFPDVRYGGRVISPGQANNAYVFPGIGLGVISSGSTRVTQEMFYSAARALADEVSPDDLKIGRVFPSLSKVRQLSACIATAVANVAFQTGLATVEQPADVRGWLESLMYVPDYSSYV